MGLASALLKNPRYTLLRGVGRFAIVRRGVTGMKRALGAAQTEQYERQLESAMGRTLFPQVNCRDFLANMNERGCAFGLQLPPRIVDAIASYADSSPVFAFRDQKLGFLPSERAAAQAKLGRDILLAQYYNTQRDCAAVTEVATDPMLNWVALKYLGSVPIFLGCNLWWTYPVKPNRADQLKHAHFFHRDIDDFKFMKFFFYLTDVEQGDGGHWIVSGSHRRAPHIRLKDYFLTRRFESEEIAQYYDKSDILEVVGPKGAGFAEDTLCVHKAATPSKHPRLMLQLQFALFDFGVGNDSRASSELSMISAG
jgi:phytanoyl-CoA dioxygenase PhyH